MTFYKAVRPDGTDFRTGKVQWAPKAWKVGRVRIVKHPTAQQVGSDASRYLSVSTVPTDCAGMKWPCRLLTVEPVEGYEVATPDPDGLPNKRAAIAWRVTGELDPLLALGAQGEHVAALIERVGRLTKEDAKRLNAAWDAAWDAAWVAAWDAAWSAARDAAWDATRVATWDATSGMAWDATRVASGGASGALVVRDLIDTAHYDALTLPWRQTIGRIHPDDPEVQA